MPKKKGKLLLILSAVVSVLVLVAVVVVAVLWSRGDKAQTAEPPEGSVGPDVSMTAPVMTPAPTPEPTTSPEPTPNQAPTAEEAEALYEAAFLASYGDDAGVLLVDMDHDGVMEMIVTHWGEIVSGGESLAGETVFDLYAIRNDAAKLILTNAVSDIHSAQGRWALYQKGDFGYLTFGGWYVSGQSGEPNPGSNVFPVYVLGEDDTLRQVAEREYLGVDLENAVMLIEPYGYYDQNSHFHAPVTAGEAQPLRGDEQRAVSLYLSNFVEQGFGPFDRAAYSDDQIINFGFRQMRRNASKAITYQNSREYIAASTVEDSANRFFGITPTRKSTDLLTYTDGSYSWGGADGAPMEVAVADTIAQQSDGTLKVTFTSYLLAEEELPGGKGFSSSMYGYTPEQARNTAGYLMSTTGTAVIEPATYKDKATYHLVKYTLDG